jgi:S-adenosylmethionine decarboxylase
VKILGRHLVVEYSGCDRNILDDTDRLQKCLNEAVRKSGATIVETVFHRYNPQGVSGVVVIAESHCSIHTWPEYGYAAVDYFTCGQNVDPIVAHRHMQQALQAETAEVRELMRGIPSETDQIIKHKQDSPAAAHRPTGT